MSADLNHPPHRHLMEEIAKTAKRFVESGQAHPTEDGKMLVDRQAYDRLVRLVEETKGIIT